MARPEIISCVALGFSALSLFMSFYVARRDTVKLRAWCTFHPTDEHNEHAYITVVVVNEGRRPAILRVLGGDLNSGGGSGGKLLGDKGLRLGENERHEEYMSYGDLVRNDPEEYEYTNLWFEDSLGNRHAVKNSEAAIREYHAS